MRVNHWAGQGCCQWDSYITVLDAGFRKYSVMLSSKDFPKKADGTYLKHMAFFVKYLLGPRKNSAQYISKKYYFYNLN